MEEIKRGNLKTNIFLVLDSFSFPGKKKPELKINSSIFKRGVRPRIYIDGTFYTTVAISQTEMREPSKNLSLTCGRYERLLVLSAYRLTALSSSMVMPPSAPPPFPVPVPPLPPPPQFEPAAPAELELQELLCRMPRLQRLQVRCLSFGGVGLPAAAPGAAPPDPPAAPDTDPARLSPPPSRLLVPVRNRL